MGRHSAPRKVLGLGLVAALTAAVACTAAAVGWNNGLFRDAAPAAAACEQPVSLVVAADPSIAPALTTVADSFDHSPGACVRTTIRSEPSDEFATVVARGAFQDVDAWVPQSSVWLDRTATAARSLGLRAPTLEQEGMVASSPIVFAVPEAKADAVAAAQPGWASVADADLPALLPDPTVSAASLAGLFALGSTLPADDQRALPGALIELGRTIPPTVDAAFTSALESDAPTAVVTTEQAAATHEGFRAIRPADTTVAVGYPFVRTTSPAPDRAALLDAFRDAVIDARATLAAAGFRDPTGAGTVDPPGASPQAAPVGPVADGPAQIDILRTWGVLALRSRFLVTIDVSGSMLQPAGGGLRRIDVFTRAADEALRQLPPENEVGAWIFSTDRANGQDWEDLSPVAPVGDLAHLIQLGQIVNSLPDRIRGGTALYDTTLAAVRRMRETYDPSKVNQVVLITDGRNDDPNSIDLQTLLDDLKREDDPARPVSVVLIGFGPDTDIESMRQIATVTGGAAYTAEKPADFLSVLVDGLLQRSCRPNC